MKKSVIITLVGVYIFSIVLVGIMGGKMKTFNELIYVEKIVCISHDELSEKEKEEFNNEFDVYIYEAFTEGVEVEIRCKVDPATATDKTIRFEFENKPNDYEVVFDQETGIATIKFFQPTSINITALSNDNGRAELKFRIDCI